MREWGMKTITDFARVAYKRERAACILHTAFKERKERTRTYNYIKIINTNNVYVAITI